MKNPLQTYQKVTSKIDNGKTIIEAVEVVIKGDPDRKLYDIYKDNQTWVVANYDNGEANPLVIKTNETDQTIEELIGTLVDKFNEGRVIAPAIQEGWATWKTSRNAFARKLNRRQVQSILRYERDGSPERDQIKAVAEANPSELPPRKDFGDYALDTWKKTENKREYLYTTFNPITKKHLDKLVFKY